MAAPGTVTPATASAPLIDRRLLERLERLTLHWQTSFNGLVGGHNRSHFAGAGQEFLDHRSFHQGDDLRSVNWRVYMRFEKLFLKMFQIEPRVPVRLLLDISSSMDVMTPDGDFTKFEFARRLAAAFVYVGLVRLDSILLQPFASRLHDPHVASGGRHRFHPAEVYLRALRSSGETRFRDIARQFLNTYRQRGLVVIISDFLDNDDCLRPLQYLADFGHELQLVQVWSEEDRSPRDTGEFELVDAETGEQVSLAIDDSARASYTAAFDGHSAALRRLAESNGGRFTGLSTAQSLEEAVFGPVMMGHAGR